MPRGTSERQGIDRACVREVAGEPVSLDDDGWHVTSTARHVRFIERRQP